MRLLNTVLNHAAVILSLMFLVFLVLDRFNPLMNFVDNGISNVLLALLCLTAGGRALAERGTGRLP